MTVIRAHKIRIKATDADKDFFARCVGTARYAFNWAEDQWQDCFLMGGYPRESEIRRFLNSIKDEALPWMNDVPKTVVQQAIKNLGTAYSRFFKKLGKHPKRKHRRDTKQSARLDNGPGTIKLKSNRAWIPKHGWVELYEQFRWPHARFMSMTLKKDGPRWFLVVSAEVEVPDKADDENQVICDGAADLGLTSALTVTDETSTVKLVAPKPMKWAMKRIAFYQRRLARTKPGSKNREKVRSKLNKAHYKVRCIGEDWQHQTTSAIAKKYDVFYLEDLNVKGLMKNHCLAGAMADVGLGEIKRQLDYKTCVVQVDRWFASTKTCHKCQHKEDGLTLSDRTWTCSACGAVHDRDENAGENIFCESQRLITLNYAFLSSDGFYRELHGKYASGDRTSASDIASEGKPQSERGIKKSSSAQV